MAMKNFTAGEVLTESDLDIYCVNTIVAIKTANESVTSSTTLQSDDHLVLALAANSTYEVNGLLIVDGASGGDIKVAFATFSGASIAMYFSAIKLTATTGGDENTVHLLEAFASSASFGTLGAADHRPVAFKGIVIVTTAGNLQLQWAQDTSSATATRVLTNSYMWARRIS